MPFGCWLARDPASSVGVVADRRVISKGEHLLWGRVGASKGPRTGRVQAALDPCSTALMVPTFPAKVIGSRMGSLTAGDQAELRLSKLVCCSSFSDRNDSAP